MTTELHSGATAAYVAAMTTTACNRCGARFVPKNLTHIYCSRRCNKAAAASRHYRRAVGHELRKHQRWSDEEIIVLACLAEGGKSATFIGTRIGRTRHAVLGKAFHLGISLKARAGRSARDH